MFHLLLFSAVALWTACGGKNEPEVIPPKPDVEITWEISPASLAFDDKGGAKSLLIAANGDWKVSSSQSWCSLSPLVGHNGQTSLKVTVEANGLETARTAELVFSSLKGESSKAYTVTQKPGKIPNHVPDGYSLVWRDEFNDDRLQGGKPALPGTAKWWFEKGNGENGWGNKELQNYIDRFNGTDTCSVVFDGTLKIIAKERGDEVISIRMNTTENWQYGYFETRLKVPTGKGTWPAFWMLPKDFKNWPLDGEIDIMEYVGYDPNVVHASIHTQAYNHVQGTQKTATRKIQNAETEFHIYAVEWTSEKIVGYVDGEAYFSFSNDGKGDVNAWPFDKPFYLKLNLAWGGNWGGAEDVDESRLPATYEIDYVRVYQKK